MNYCKAGFQPKLGNTIVALCEYIRDALFVKKVPNFRVLCLNRMIGVGQQRQEPTDEEAAKSPALWGPDPVHPTGAAARAMADSLESDIQNQDARYMNPAKPYPVVKKTLLRAKPGQRQVGQQLFFGTAA
jgi:hypothetical protein